MSINQTRVALVAGGSGDIGRSIASALLAEGFTVSSADVKHSPAHLDQHPGFHHAEVDLTDRDAVDSWLDDVEHRWGPIEVLVVSVGSVRSGRIVDMTEREWSADLDSLLNAPRVVATSTIRRMLKSNSESPRRIVFIGSWAAESPHPHIGAYSIAKAGLRALMRTLALDHSGDNILINEVAPGIVDAGLSRAVLASQPELAESIRGQIPVNLLIHPDEIGVAVLNLCDARARSTTGSVITIDGGLSLTSAMHIPQRSNPDGVSGGTQS